MGGGGCFSGGQLGAYSDNDYDIAPNGPAFTGTASVDDVLVIRWNITQNPLSGDLGVFTTCGTEIPTSVAIGIEDDSMNFDTCDDICDFWGQNDNCTFGAPCGTNTYCNYNDVCDITPAMAAAGEGQNSALMVVNGTKLLEDNAPEDTFYFYVVPGSIPFPFMSSDYDFNIRFFDWFAVQDGVCDAQPILDMGPLAFPTSNTVTGMWNPGMHSLQWTVNITQAEIDGFPGGGGVSYVFESCGTSEPDIFVSFGTYSNEPNITCETFGSNECSFGNQCGANDYCNFEDRFTIHPAIANGADTPSLVVQNWTTPGTHYVTMWTNTVANMSWFVNDTIAPYDNVTCQEYRMNMMPFFQVENCTITIDPTSAEPTTASPTVVPTVTPTNQPIVSPTGSPTKQPTDQPIVSPTGSPTKQPTDQPNVSPTGNPTKQPTDQPNVSPTNNPTLIPTRTPVSPSTNPFWLTRSSSSNNFLPNFAGLNTFFGNLFSNTRPGAPGAPGALNNRPRPSSGSHTGNGMTVGGNWLRPPVTYDPDDCDEEM